MKLRYIDAIRGIAIVMVMMIHSGQHASKIYRNMIWDVIGIGANGVQLFFLASAFTLFLSYNFRQKKEVNPRRNFFIRRFFRIAPLYYLAVIYFLFQNGLGPRYWLGDAEGISIGNIISNIFFTHGINPYWITSVVPGGWSITVEMTFYLIVPFLFKKISNINQAIQFTYISVLCSVALNFLLSGASFISDERLWTDYLFFYFPNHIALFGLGIIAYFLILKKDKAISPANCLIISVILGSHLIWSYIPTHFLFGVAFLILMISLAKKESLLFVNKFTVFFGKISYSAYFVHFAVLHWLSQLELIYLIPVDGQVSCLINFCMKFTGVLIATSIVSWIILHVVERPFQKLGKKLILRLELKK